MDFAPETRRLRLRSVNPGYTVADVVRHRGWEVILPAEVPTTPPPSDPELLLPRGQVDRGGTLRQYRLTIG